MTQLALAAVPRDCHQHPWGLFRLMLQPGCQRPEPGLLGWRAVKGSWDQVLLRCACSLPADVTAAAEGAFLLGDAEC